MKFLGWYAAHIVVKRCRPGNFNLLYVVVFLWIPIAWLEVKRYVLVWFGVPGWCKVRILGRMVGGERASASGKELGLRFTELSR